MTTTQTNAALEIVKLGEQRFKVPGGYIVPKGYAFRHPALGFLGFADKPGQPYIPVGGRKALKEILAAGGFLSFDGMEWIHEMK